MRVASRPHDGHHRTPGYLKGKTGRVERVDGTFTNPETRAYGGDGLPEQRLYNVGFAQSDVWPGYAGPAGDWIYVDVYEHWLEPVGSRWSGFAATNHRILAPLHHPSRSTEPLSP